MLVARLVRTQILTLGAPRGIQIQALNDSHSLARRGVDACVLSVVLVFPLMRCPLRAGGAQRAH